MSPLHRALQRVVRVQGRGPELRRLSPQTHRLELVHDGVLRVLIGDTEVACMYIDAHRRDLKLSYQLSVFECRYLAEYGRVYPIPKRSFPTARLRTDLHSHYAGCTSASTLVELAAANGVTCSPDMLAAAGIRVQGTAAVAVASLSPPIRARLVQRLEVPAEGRITFVDMERIYRLRSPLTKHPDMFVPLLRQIADDYSSMGIDYAELSMGDIPRASRLRAVHEHVPAIEASTGVTLRFLAAMSRHDDLEWDLDYIDRLRAVAASGYIVGVDFMGHETNSTRAFAAQIREVAHWAGRVRPGFVVRVHAGENPAYPENVRVAVDCVQGHDVTLRIGHGLYGVDDATLGQLASRGVIVEFNLNSNFALNNIQQVGEAPLRRYLRHGVRCVLGSDGYGIYRTTPALEMRAAWLCGLGDGEFEQVAQAERWYLERRRATGWNLGPAGGGFVVPDDSPHVHFSVAVTQRGHEHRRERDEQLARRVAHVGAHLLSRDGLLELVSGTRCMSIAGAWKHSWHILSPAEQSRIRRELECIVRGLDPARDVLFTGGTEFGVEGLVAEFARVHGIRHVGVLVASTPPESLRAGLMTYAVVVGQSLHDKAAELYSLMRETNGLCVFVGGGNIVSDEIQCARNLRVRYMLMADVAGASSNHARQQPLRAFTTAAEVLDVLTANWAAPVAMGYRYVGVNPTVDVVASRRNEDSGALELLLVRRHMDSPAESGVWALPGGFVATSAAAGTAWQPGTETDQAAALRELYQETGLDLRDLESRLTLIGHYEGGGRDPRDSQTAWSRTAAFALTVPVERAVAPVAGGDDACDARWFDVSALPLRLAFDHATILRDWMLWSGG